MNTATILLFVLLAATPVSAHLEDFEIAVGTDRRVYQPGEGVEITVTVNNATSEPRTHGYACSCCVYDLWIVNEREQTVARERQLACPQVVGQWEFEPFESRKNGTPTWWQNVGDFGYNDPPPHQEHVPPGTYRLVVEWYGKAIVTSSPFAICDGECPEPRSFFIPAAGNNTGLHGTTWISDLGFQSLGGGDSFVTLSLIEHGVANAATESAEIIVRDFGVQHVKNVLGTLFGHVGQAAIHLEIRGGDVDIASRTYNVDDAGTYGQAVPAVPVADARNSVLLAGLKNGDDRWRTNIGVINLRPEPITIEILLNASPNGSLSPTRIELALGPFEYRQLNDVWNGRVHPVFPIDQGNAWIRSIEGTHGRLFLAYASVIDNRTGDAVFVQGIPARGEGNLY